jgi:hypothetical protein
MALVTTSAAAEQRTFYGSDGKVVGRSVTGSNGAVTLYGADGKVVGCEATPAAVPPSMTLLVTRPAAYGTAPTSMTCLGSACQRPWSQRSSPR